jgi:hypothetical protein
MARTPPLLFETSVPAGHNRRSFPVELSPPRQRGPVILDYQSSIRFPSSGRAVRVRGERHNPLSIATLRIKIARYLKAQFSCHSCGAVSLMIERKKK